MSQIGTSVNLVVASLAQNSLAGPHAKGRVDFDFFSVGEAGIPTAICGVLYMVAMAPRWLPIKDSPANVFQSTYAANFVTAMVVADSSRLIGQAVGAAGIAKQFQGAGIRLIRIERRSGHSVRVVSIERGDAPPLVHVHNPSTGVNGTAESPSSRHHGTAGDSDDSEHLYHTPSSPQHQELDAWVLEEGDVLHLVCQGAAAAPRAFQSEGLRPVATTQVKKLPGSRRDRGLVVAVVGAQSSVAGCTLVECQFRKRFGAVVLGLHRHGGISDSGSSGAHSPDGDGRPAARWSTSRRSLHTADSGMVPPSPHTLLRVQCMPSACALLELHACCASAGGFTVRLLTCVCCVVVWSRRWQAGDGLLLEVGQRFLQEHSGGSVDFTVVSPVEGAPWRSVLPSQRPRHALLAAVMLLFTVVATATQLLALGTAVLLSNIVFTVCGTVSVKDMFRAVSLRTLITVACALALGKALVRSAWRRAMRWQHRIRAHVVRSGGLWGRSSCVARFHCAVSTAGRLLCVAWVVPVHGLPRVSGGTGAGSDADVSGGVAPTQCHD